MPLSEQAIHVRCWHVGRDRAGVRVNIEIDYPKVRRWHTCVVCSAQKAAGLVLCWPCHRAAKEAARARSEDSDYTSSVVALLNAVEAKL